MIATLRTPPGRGSWAWAARWRSPGATVPAIPAAATPPRKLRRDGNVRTRGSRIARSSLDGRWRRCHLPEEWLAPAEHVLDSTGQPSGGGSSIGHDLGVERPLPRVPDLLHHGGTSGRITHDLVPERLHEPPRRPAVRSPRSRRQGAGQVGAPDGHRKGHARARRRLRAPRDDRTLPAELRNHGRRSRAGCRLGVHAHGPPFGVAVFPSGAVDGAAVVVIAKVA